MFSGLKPYPEYRPLGIDWLQQVPAAWGTTKLKRLATARGGATPARDRAEYWNGDIPWVTPKVMKSDVITSSTDHVSESALTGTSLSLIAPGAVLIVVRGMILARRVPVAVNRVPVTINQDMKALVTRGDVSGDYLAAALRGAEDSLLASVSESGHGTRKLDTEVWSEFRIPVPGPAEQAAIVRYLAHANARIDRAIAAKRRLIALLEEQKRVVIKQAVTRGLDRTVPMKDSGIPWLGQIPAHWKVWPIGRLARVGNGSTPSRSNPEFWEGGHYPWLNSASVNLGDVSEAGQFVTSRALTECHLPIVNPDSVIVAITGQGATRGKVALLSIEATINQHLAFATPNTRVIEARFLRAVLGSAYSELRRISDDSGSTKGALTCGDIKSFRVPVPPIEEQQQIVENTRMETATADKAVARTRRELDLLREFRTSLTAEVVTGQVDVREIAANLPDMDPAEAVGVQVAHDDEGDLDAEGEEYLDGVTA